MRDNNENLLPDYDLSNANSRTLWLPLDKQPAEKAFIVQRLEGNQIKSTVKFCKENASKILEKLAKKFDTKSSLIRVHYVIRKCGGGEERMVLQMKQPGGKHRKCSIVKLKTRLVF